MKASNASPPLPWNREIAQRRFYWQPGLVAALLLLAGQVMYFEGVAFSRKPAVRAILENICRPLGCRLPAYRNPGEFAVLQSSWSALPDHSRLFRAVISNRAAFAQPYPDLELILLDYAENPAARRIFRPQDYLPETGAASLDMPPDATIEISLNIAALKTKIGGYTFELM